MNRVEKIKKLYEAYLWLLENPGQKYNGCLWISGGFEGLFPHLVNGNMREVWGVELKYGHKMSYEEFEASAGKSPDFGIDKLFDGVNRHYAY